MARIYSLYRFFRDVDVDETNLVKRHYAAVKAAKQFSFADFVTSENEIVKIYTSNQHSRQLTGSPWALQSSIDIAAAKTKIDEMDCFYVCEQPEASVRWMNQVIGIDSVPHLNVTAAPPVEDEIAAMEALILERNESDLLLWEHGISVLKVKSSGAQHQGA